MSFFSRKSPEFSIVRINAQVLWRFGQDRATGRWVGICDLLSLTVSGDTWNEAAEGASEAMDLLFEDLIEDGEFDAFLRARGWRTVDPMPGPHVRVKIDLPAPYELMDNGAARELALN